MNTTIRVRLLTVALVALCLPFMVSITYRVIPMDAPRLDGIAELRREVRLCMAEAEDDLDDGVATVESVIAAAGTDLEGHRVPRPVKDKPEFVRAEIAETVSESEPEVTVPAEDADTEAPAEDSELEQDIDIIATLVFHEAWGGCSDRHRELVAAVVYNRVNSDLFPDTVYGVVTQVNQYKPAYADAESFYGRAARADPEIWETCREIARKALSGEVDCPADVVFQAESPQGETGIYEIHYTSYSTTYFCYG